MEVSRRIRLRHRWGWSSREETNQIQWSPDGTVTANGDGQQQTDARWQRTKLKSFKLQLIAADSDKTTADNGKGHRTDANNNDNAGGQPRTETRAAVTQTSDQKACNGSEEKLDDVRSLVGKADGDPLRIVSVGVGAWGNVFVGLLQDTFGQFRDKVKIRIWRRLGKVCRQELPSDLETRASSQIDEEAIGLLDSMAPERK
ncbi:hypothetical protein LR48_Vigan03g182500 [Vigna angularis]|uniref:Glycerol-3-phosphate dehydrogenase NAD-dependent N-terminal domain-containing protein n=1 Tax=Phaseolus angularis TaxID=3914 RepID=A0A0L9U6M5_PHAAN|nr:hypothetical protein LR48_Vigan03g182500 [Vigna angularis]